MRLAAVLVLLLTSPTSLLAQSPADYLDLKETYVDRPDDAVRALKTWPLRVVQEGVGLCLSVAGGSHTRWCSTQQRLAAAMMHSEVAADLVGSAPPLASFHVRMARSLLNNLKDQDAFIQRWFEFVAMLHLFEGVLDPAASLAEDGIRRYPTNARLFVVRGAVSEVGVTAQIRDPRGAARETARVRSGSAGRGLQSAAGDYREALRLAPDLAMARLRLGWTLFLLGDTRAAEELGRVLASTTDFSIRYLAHLFLGGIAEQRQDVTAALTSYQAARAEAPQAQTACLAVAHAAGSLGQPRAAAIALECLVLPKDRDPWWSYAFGEVDSGTFAWLRREARRR